MSEYPLPSPSFNADDDDFLKALMKIKDKAYTAAQSFNDMSVAMGGFVEPTFTSVFIPTGGKIRYDGMKDLYEFFLSRVFVDPETGDKHQIHATTHVSVQVLQSVHDIDKYVRDVFDDLAYKIFKDWNEYCWTKGMKYPISSFNVGPSLSAPFKTEHTPLKDIRTLIPGFKVNELGTEHVPCDCANINFGSIQSLERVIYHLNDDHGTQKGGEWSREKIADWLDELHNSGILDLSVEVPDVTYKEK